MKSTRNVAWRVVVMVACLFAIPLAALFGTSLPDLVRRVLDLSKSLAPAEAVDSRADDPFFGRGPRDPAGSSMPNRGASGFRTPETRLFSSPPEPPRDRIAPHGWPPTDMNPTAGWADCGQYAGESGSPAGFNTASQPEAIPASYFAEVDPPPGHPANWPQEPEAGSARPGFGGLAGASRGATGSGSCPSGHSSLVPVASAGPVQTCSGSACPSRPSGAERGTHALPVRAPSATDQFTYIQRRLRELGATYYLLETWGAQGQYFRFHARIAIGGSPDYSRRFEATDTDALRAMAKVLEQVEAGQATSR
jgi:hypothetical protein